MPTYGCFRVEEGRTWKADYVLKNGGQIEFWNRSRAKGKPDIMIGAAILEKGYTICDMESTNINIKKEPSFYHAIVDRSQEASPILGQ